MAELIVALDVANAGEAHAIADKLRGTVSWLKIGLELFTACGPELVRSLSETGFKIFLDLKFFDIPNTVAGAVRSAGSLNVDLLTLHCQGGQRMCSAAVEAARELSSAHRPLLFGVTVLTSFANGEMPGIGVDAACFAQQLAGVANESGLDGLVCSGREVQRIKKNFPRLLCLCPGIRPAQDSGDDQRRTVTPEQAVAAGADYLVVGRPVLRASDPVGAARSILAQMCVAHC